MPPGLPGRGGAICIHHHPDIPKVSYLPAWKVGVSAQLPALGPAITTTRLLSLLPCLGGA